MRIADYEAREALKGMKVTLIVVVAGVLFVACAVLAAFAF